MTYVRHNPSNIQPNSYGCFKFPLRNGHLYVAIMRQIDVRIVNDFAIYVDPKLQSNLTTAQPAPHSALGSQ